MDYCINGIFNKISGHIWFKARYEASVEQIEFSRNSERSSFLARTS